MNYHTILWPQRDVCVCDYKSISYRTHFSSSSHDHLLRNCPHANSMGPYRWRVSLCSKKIRNVVCAMLGIDDAEVDKPKPESDTTANSSRIFSVALDCVIWIRFLLGQMELWRIFFLTCLLNRKTVHVSKLLAITWLAVNTIWLPNRSLVHR